jgi:hypothetical protein
VTHTHNPARYLVPRPGPWHRALSAMSSSLYPERPCYHASAITQTRNRRHENTVAYLLLS